MKRVGIMGGTFNPIHNGHLILAKEAYYQYDLDYVYVMPNKLPAYKNPSDIVDVIHRETMVRLAIREYPYMIYSELELNRGGKTYTIDTLRELHLSYPDETYYFIMGGDSLATLHLWYQYEEILQETAILCARRDEQDTDALYEVRKELLKVYPNAVIDFLDTPDIPISSSLLRKRIASGLDVSSWIPESVYHYIHEHHLYEHV
ncbi:MAG: nicotinate-nucleotide adenylyltransferase [Lachnospiraceae bacterium]|nr:nicotinate-nucleotide adenylyltransferase [Lachnospiraceae bacterium]